MTLPPPSSTAVHNKQRRRRWRPHALPTVARPGVLALLWTGLLVYGSLLPFDLQLERLIAHPAEGFRSLGLASNNTLSGVDLVTNLVLYVPLGVMLRIALRRRGWPVFAQIAAGSAVIAALSVGMEWLQAWSPTRVASLADVAANVGMGVAAVLVAPWLWSVTMRVAFFVYCRLAGPIHAVRVRLRFLRRSPAALMAVVFVNAALLTAWYATQAAYTFAGPAIADADTPADEVTLPFARHFGHSYDTAALLLGRSLLVYAALGCLVSLTMLRTRARLPLRRIVLAVLAVALGVELYRGVVSAGAFRADITEPVIALGAALLMGITTYLFAHAVKRSNRREAQADYDGPDRRRVRYRYAEPE